MALQFHGCTLAEGRSQLGPRRPTTPWAADLSSEPAGPCHAEPPSPWASRSAVGDALDSLLDEALARAAITAPGATGFPRPHSEVRRPRAQPADEAPPVRSRVAVVGFR